MKMYNHEIYNRAIALLNAFGEDSTQKFPIKLSYSIKKNTKALQSIAEGIEKSRLELIDKYSVVNENDEKVIPADKVDEANAEFTELMNIEEEVAIHTIKIGSLSDSVELTDAQMEAIMFMIEDDE